MGTGVSELEKSARWSQQRLAAPVMAGPPLPQSLPWGCIWMGGGGSVLGGREGFPCETRLPGGTPARG